jgi:hypothetical protein
LHQYSHLKQINNTDICWKQLFWTTIESNNVGELKAALAYAPPAWSQFRTSETRGLQLCINIYISNK